VAAPPEGQALPKGDKGSGPPPGSPADYAGAPQIPIADLVKQAERQLGFDGVVAPNDPGFIAPHDPLQAVDSKSRAQLVYRDLPLVTIQNTWSVDQARNALYSHTTGIFEQSGQLCDSIMGDDRVIPTLGSRIGGLFGREVSFEAADDSDAARECRDAWVNWWPRLFGDGAFYELSAYQILMGWGHSQIVWDTSSTIWGPYLRPWHPRFEFYHWTLRKFVAMSQDGLIPVTGGDAKWLVHEPHGSYRAWMWGAIRAITEPWLLRHFARRDMARYSEVHGQPIRIGETPAAADAGQRAQFEASLARLGSETTLLLGKGVDEQNSYGFKLVEASDAAWEVFPGLEDRCDMAIVLAILFCNLTTEVKGGSFAATSAHMDIRESGIQFDGTAWANTIYTQLARPFAYLNFGDANLAPWSRWDVKPRQNYEYKAKQFQQFGTAVEVLARGGVKFKDVEQLRTFAAKNFGLDGLPDFEIKDPVSASGAGGAAPGGAK
jgi:hypothetical protein